MQLQCCSFSSEPALKTPQSWAANSPEASSRQAKPSNTSMAPAPKHTCMQKWFYSSNCLLKVLQNTCPKDILLVLTKSIVFIFKKTVVPQGYFSGDVKILMNIYFLQKGNVTLRRARNSSSCLTNEFRYQERISKFNYGWILSLQFTMHYYNL